MHGIVMLVLLGTTTVLLVAILFVFIVILRHSRRVERLAQETRALLERAEQNAEREPPADKDEAPGQ